MSSVAIKISSDLASVARAASADADRSLTGQIEHWARLGKAVEPVLSSVTIALLKKSGGDLSTIEDEREKARVLEVLERFRNTPQEALRNQLGLDKKTAYFPDPDRPGGLVRVLSDGSRQSGRKIDGAFVAD